MVFKGICVSSIGVLMVWMFHTIRAAILQMILWQQENVRAESIMTVMDDINQKFGQGSLFTAANGLEQSWQMQRGNVSNRYTTHFKELMVVK